MRNLTVLVLLAAAMVACKRPKGDNPEEKRQFVDEMHDVTLGDLYKRKPAAKAHVQNAPGYAVFNNLQTKFGIAASGLSAVIVRQRIDRLNLIEVLKTRE